MNNGSNIHSNGLQPPTTAAERLVSARKQSPALKAISRYNFPWTGALTHLLNTQMHSNNTVALTTAVQIPNNGRCLQLGYRVVSSTCLSAFIVFNQTIRLQQCSFLKIEEIAIWKLFGIACENFNLKFSLEKKDKWACLNKKKTFSSAKEMCCFHAECPHTVRRSSINVIQWPVCTFSLLMSKQIKTHVVIPTVGIKRFESPFEISVVIKRPLWYLNSIFSCSFIWNKKKIAVFASGVYEIKKLN